MANNEVMMKSAVGSDMAMQPCLSPLFLYRRLCIRLEQNSFNLVEFRSSKVGSLFIQLRYGKKSQYMHLDHPSESVFVLDDAKVRSLRVSLWAQSIDDPNAIPMLIAVSDVNIDQNIIQLVSLGPELSHPYLCSMCSNHAVIGDVVFAVSLLPDREPPQYIGMRYPPGLSTPPLCPIPIGVIASCLSDSSSSLLRHRQSSVSLQNYTIAHQNVSQQTSNHDIQVDSTSAKSSNNQQIKQNAMASISTNNQNNVSTTQSLEWTSPSTNTSALVISPPVSTYAYEGENQELEIDDVSMRSDRAEHSVTCEKSPQAKHIIPSIPRIMTSKRRSISKYKSSAKKYLRDMRTISLSNTKDPDGKVEGHNRKARSHISRRQGESATKSEIPLNTSSYSQSPSRSQKAHTQRKFVKCHSAPIATVLPTVEDRKEVYALSQRKRYSWSMRTPRSGFTNTYRTTNEEDMNESITWYNHNDCDQDLLPEIYYGSLHVRVRHASFKSSRDGSNVRFVIFVGGMALRTLPIHFEGTGDSEISIQERCIFQRYSTIPTRLNIVVARVPTADEPEGPWTLNETDVFSSVTLRFHNADVEANKQSKIHWPTRKDSAHDESILDDSSTREHNTKRPSKTPDPLDTEKQAGLHERILFHGSVSFVANPVDTHVPKPFDCGSLFLEVLCETKDLVWDERHSSYDEPGSDIDSDWSLSDCDCDHSIFVELLEKEYPIPVEELYTMLFNPQFTHYQRLYNHARSYTDCKSGTWRDVDGVKETDREYAMPLNIRMGPSQTRVREHLILSTDKTRVKVVNLYNETPDVPYGSYFKVHLRYCFTHSNTTHSKLRIGYQLIWTKSTLLKVKINSATHKGLEEMAVQVDYCINQCLKDDGPDERLTNGSKASRTSTVPPASNATRLNNEGIYKAFMTNMNIMMNETVFCRVCVVLAVAVAILHVVLHIKLSVLLAHLIAKQQLVKVDL